MSEAPVTRLSVLAAFAEGWRRALSARGLVALIVLSTMLVGCPLATVARMGASEPTDSSLAFAHQLLGFGGGLDLVSVALKRDGPGFVQVFAAVGFLTFWAFLSGGILDRLARARPLGAAAFFGACGGYLGRIVRLAILTGLVYWIVFERVSSSFPAVPAAVFFAALALIGLIVDFAKVRAVVEDRRSALSAIVASLRFIRRRPIRTLTLYALNALVVFAVFNLWTRIAPADDASAWIEIVRWTLYLVLQTWTMLAFVASETVFFQHELAHAHYTAAPELVWPDSPAAEAIENLTRRA
jgi:hypothetical protein